MTIQRNETLRNIAIIAHVDHGKTTLVDQMFKQSGAFKTTKEIEERVMDNMAIEKERGITIAAKNCSVEWKGARINILDTPGHADFGGEVERALAMVDAAILLVDAAEGPLPQTRFVLKKALEKNLAIIVCINKIDRKDARPEEVLNEIYDLFIDLEANDTQIEFPVLYAIGRDGIAQKTLTEPGADLSVLFETILAAVPAPSYDDDEPFQMLVCDLDYSDYLGRLAIGRIFHGTARVSETLVCVKEHGRALPLRVAKLQTYEGAGFKEIEEAKPGDIVILAGIENVEIGDTIATKERPKALPRLSVDPPTVAMEFGINTSPLAGREGAIVQAARIWERLQKEALSNVGITVEKSDANVFTVKGRGELQMAVIIETMRREGFELSVGRPRVIYKEANGITLEPIERLFIDCNEESLGIVSEKLSRRKGVMLKALNHGSGRVRIEFHIPSRSLIGYRSQFLTDTKGTGVMSSSLHGYEPYKGDFTARQTGSLVSDRMGKTTPYALFGLEERGKLFIEPGVEVYEGMIIGEHARDNDLDVNSCREKKLTNIRAAGKDENVILTRVTPMTLEKAMEFIRDDEMIEVTPKNIRIRKTVLSAQIRYSTRGRLTKIEA